MIPRRFAHMQAELERAGLTIAPVDSRAAKTLTKKVAAPEMPHDEVRREQQLTHLQRENDELKAKLATLGERVDANVPGGQERKVNISPSARAEGTREREGSEPNRQAARTKRMRARRGKTT